MPHVTEDVKYHLVDVIGSIHYTNAWFNNQTYTNINVISTKPISSGG